MSNMILCDSCKKSMFADCRSEKGAYHEIWIDRSSQFHLCRQCYLDMMKNVFHMCAEDFELED